MTITLLLAPPRSTLTLAKGAEESEARSIEVSDCWEGADAAALIVAVAVQSELTSNAGVPPPIAANDTFTAPPLPPALPAPDGFAPAVNSDSDPSSHAALNPHPARSRVAAARGERAAEKPRPQHPKSPTGRPWSVRFGMGAVAQSSFGLAPIPLLGGSAVFTVEANRRG